MGYKVQTPMMGKTHLQLDLKRQQPHQSKATMKSMIVLLVVLAIAQIYAAPQFFGFPGGNGAGFGTGNAGLFGASGTGVGVSNAYNGGYSSSGGTVFGSSNPFLGYNAGGNGFSNSFGK